MTNAYVPCGKHVMFTILTLGLVLTDFILCQSVSTNRTYLSSALLRNIIRDYGTNGTLTFQQIDSLVRKKDGFQISDHTPILGTVSLTTVPNITCLTNLKDNSSQGCTIRGSPCLTVEDVFHLYNLGTTSVVNETSLEDMAPVLLYLLTQNCSGSDGKHHKHHTPPTSMSTWGYGFLFVTFINLCSLVGVIVLPCMKMASYKQILIFMVALAVGALSGSGLLFLIPEAFGLVSEDDEEQNKMYIFKASTIMGGIYLFYLTEKVMRIIANWKERCNMKQKTRNQMSATRDGDDVKGSRPSLMDIICSVKQLTPMNQEQIYKEPSTLPNNISCTQQQQQQQTELLDKSSDDSTYGQDNVVIDDMLNGDDEMQNYSSSKAASSHSHHTIKPLAWMIIFGDGLHNFIDGLSIGTAFTQSTLSGISVSLAVMCEELPHELGDFAILLNCGMSVKKALLYNFLSACMCYFGLVVGILLGENTSSHDWVFAIAGGMFLYISLADMMPEMNSASESEGGKRNNTGQVFLLQNLGLLSGFGIMFILAMYGGNISFE